MSRTIKKIIMRKGLVILGIVLLGIVIFLISGYLKDLTAPPVVTDAEMSNSKAECWRWMNFFAGGENFGIFIIIFGCPIYLLICAIIWAIKADNMTKIKEFLKKSNKFIKKRIDWIMILVGTFLTSSSCINIIIRLKTYSSKSLRLLYKGSSFISPSDYKIRFIFGIVLIVWGILLYREKRNKIS